MTSLRDTLDLAVAISTRGVSSSARPAQADLAEAIQKAFKSCGRLAAEAPTGSGKSLAVLVPAMLAAADGRRTVISTETLGLQSQITLKDGPAAAEAVSRVTGYKPSIVALKGWSNYGCSLAAAHSASSASGPVKELADWVASEAARGGTGDRADCPLPTVGQDGADMWEEVSISTAACPGKDECPFGNVCLPIAARQRAADADIVVVNHSMLAMQAVTGAPVVIGGEQLGHFDHLVIDEAHSLADKVRSHGSATLSAWSLVSAARAVEACLGRRHKTPRQGLELAKALDEQLGMSLARYGEQKALADDVDPLDSLGGAIEAWISRERRAISSGRRSLMAAAVADGKLDELAENLRRLDKDGMARWIERGEPSETGGLRLTGVRVTVAPVETGGALAGNLYKANGEAPLAVVALSATLPSLLLPELGIGATLSAYPSPFSEAYANSLLFVPRLTASTPAPLDAGGRFDISKHKEWAKKLVQQLVDANDGSALVLAATTNAAREYAQSIEECARGRWAVHTQWDGPINRVVEAWRDDVGSVLIGTRGLMTGVDAPGVTCSLVIVDRVPRAAPNPVDDARRDRIAVRLKMKHWEADRYVYVADAALLLKQAAGRLIRSSSDRGMVAVLDPRLLKNQVSYPVPTRKAFLSALERFTMRTTDLDEALAYLRQSRRLANA